MQRHATYSAPIEQVLQAKHGFIGRCGIKRGLTCKRCAARRKLIKKLTNKARRRNLEG